MASDNKYINLAGLNSYHLQLKKSFLDTIGTNTTSITSLEAGQDATADSLGRHLSDDAAHSNNKYSAGDGLVKDTTGDSAGTFMVNFGGTGVEKTVSRSDHTHNYAGASSAGGVATEASKVSNKLTINGSEYDGSAAVPITIPYIDAVEVNPRKVESGATLTSSTDLNALTNSTKKLIINLDVPKGDTGATGARGPIFFEGSFTAKKAYTDSECAEYSSRKGNVSWSQNEVVETLNADNGWKVGNYILFTIISNTGKQYISIQKVVSANALLPYHYWTLQKGTTNERLSEPDTRNDNQLPSWYLSTYPRSIVTEFKYCNKIGVNSLLSSTYCNLTTIIPWTDNSGGMPIQFATNSASNAKVAFRVSSDDGTKWNAWGVLGAQGPKGDTGTISVGSVTKGTTASVTNSGSSTAAKFDFVLPKGDKGDTGTISIGSVTKGTVASVTNKGTSTAAVFDFVLPKGDKGDTTVIGIASQMHIPHNGSWTVDGYSSEKTYIAYKNGLLMATGEWDIFATGDHYDFKDKLGSTSEDSYDLLITEYTNATISADIASKTYVTSSLTNYLQSTAADSKYLSKTGGTLTGPLTVSGAVKASTLESTGDIAANTARLTAVDASGNISGNNITARGSINAGSIKATGDISGATVHGSVWNDLTDSIEVPDVTEIEPGYCYCFDGENYYKSTKYLDEGIIGIHSDTSGFNMGKKGRSKEIDIAVSGFVLAYVDKDYKPGTPLTCTEGGKLTEISLQDKRDYPERIIGTFWKREFEGEWGPEYNKIAVNNRCWVKVK